MIEETNRDEAEVKDLTKEELKAQLISEIELLKLELEHSTLVTDIQEQSTKRSSLLVQEANIIASNNQNQMPIKKPTQEKATVAVDSYKDEGISKSE